MRLAFIQAFLKDQKLKDAPIARHCEMLEVGASQATKQVRAARLSGDAVLKQAKIIRSEMKHAFWLRQMHALLLQGSIDIETKQLGNVLQVSGIICCRSFKRTVRTAGNRRSMLRAQLCSEEAQQKHV